LLSVDAMRRILLPTALLATALLLTGCSAGASPTSYDAPMTSEGGAPDVEFSQGTDTAVSDLDRQVITTGWVSIKVDSPLDAAAEAVRITERAGGRIDGRTENAPRGGDGGSASLTLRIPADDLTAV